MENYTREIDELKTSLVYAYQNWQIWWFFKSKVNRYTNLYNRYLLFFDNCRYAHWITTIMSIWCLIDDKNISLIRLYKELLKEKLLDKITKDEVDKRLNGIKKNIKGIKIIRHQVIAHISEKIDSEKAYELANLEDLDIRNIIVELGNILNIICDYIGVSIIRFDFIMRADEPDKIYQENGDIEKLFIDLENNVK